MFDCPVCHTKMAQPPADYNICERCGTEFGNDDDGVTHIELRERWMAKGMPWLVPAKVHMAATTVLVFHCPRMPLRPQRPCERRADECGELLGLEWQPEQADLHSLNPGTRSRVRQQGSPVPLLCD